MRILHLVHQYMPEFVGGTELYTQALGRAQRRQGHEVGVFVRRYDGSRGLLLSHEAETGARLFEAGAGPATPTGRFLSTFGSRLLEAQWRASLDQFRPDLVHVQHLMGLPAALLDHLHDRQIPYLVTLLDYWWVCANANLLTNFDEQPCDGPRAYLNCARCAVARSRRRAAWLAAPAAVGGLAWRAARLRRLLERAEALLAPSDFVRGWYAAHGAPEERLHTTRWGVMLPEGGPPAHSPSQGPLRLLYIGGLAPNKGVHVVLEALRSVQGAWELAVAGDEAQHPAYAGLLRSLAGPNVRFLGALGREQVWQALARADVVVVPSLWHETFCLVAHEARAAGAVVFASRMGALTEAIRHDVDGLLLPPGDLPAWRAALQRAVDDRAGVETLRARIEPVRTFDAHVQQVEAHYAQIARRRDTAPPNTAPPNAAPPNAAHG